MSLRKRKTVAKAVMVLYVLISATFSLDHKDFVPLEARLFISTSRGVFQEIDNVGDTFVCPAHNFAQSTASCAVSHDRVELCRSYFFFRIERRVHLPFSTPDRYSTRAPPEA